MGLELPPTARVRDVSDTVLWSRYLMDGNLKAHTEDHIAQVYCDLQKSQHVLTSTETGHSVKNTIGYCW